MTIELPRGLEIDLDDIPDNLEEQVQKCFAEYTDGTNPKFMYHDKLCFVDVMVKKLHGDKDSYYAVMDAMKDYLEYEVREYGNIPSKEDYLDVEFMEHCYKLGQRSVEMYSHEWQKKQRKHDDDKIMKVLCRAVKAVMDYEWGKDGVFAWQPLHAPYQPKEDES
jgi:hypothetical protein